MKDIRIKNGTLKNIPDEWKLFNQDEAGKAEKVLVFGAVEAENPLLAFMRGDMDENEFIDYVVAKTIGYRDNHVWYIADKPMPELFDRDIYIDRARG